VIQAVLFDGDQTLWDFQKVMHSALAAVLDEIRAARPGAGAHGLEISDLQADRDEVASELQGVEFSLARLRRLGFARSLRRLRETGDQWTEKDDDALTETLTVSYFAHRDRDPALFDDTVPCLESLRPHFRLGLLSNGSRMPEVVGLGGYFEAVVFAQDHQVAKPDRGIFSVAERLMQIEPGGAVLVGDHPLNDVVGAKQAGWRAVWIDRLGGGAYAAPEGFDEEPDAVITSLDQLQGVLARL
jgi:FMN hydrolase / 5-amino-6-(5-phospho-D-ribitylamino)uracil phosphatase